MPAIQPITATLLDDLLAQARQSPRLRTIHCLHDGDWEHCHRMLNALTVGTYVRPHRHRNEHQSEGFIVLRGALAVLIFDDAGEVDLSQSYVLSSPLGTFGLNLQPNLWHTLVALADTVIYEVKGHPTGGYVAERDKDFAPWAPAEGEAEAVPYLRILEAFAQRLLH